MFSIRSMVLIVCIAILDTSAFAEADSSNVSHHGGTAAGMTILVEPVDVVGLASEKRKRKAAELEVGKGDVRTTLRILEVKTGKPVKSAEAKANMGE